jgi:hypothetical protein
VGSLYPNPVKSGSETYLTVEGPSGSAADWEIFTAAYRNVSSGNGDASGHRVLTVGLKDLKGVELAGGLYFLRVRLSGPSASLQRIFPLVVLR